MPSRLGKYGEPYCSLTSIPQLRRRSPFSQRASVQSSLSTGWPKFRSFITMGSKGDFVPLVLAWLVPAHGLKALGE